MYLVTDNNRYFVEIKKNNKIHFTKDINKATITCDEDAEELIPLIKLYSDKVVKKIK